MSPIIFSVRNKETEQNNKSQARADDHPIFFVYNVYILWYLKIPDPQILSTSENYFLLILYINVGKYIVRIRFTGKHVQIRFCEDILISIREYDVPVYN